MMNAFMAAGGSMLSAPKDVTSSRATPAQRSLPPARFFPEPSLSASSKAAPGSKPASGTKTTEAAQASPLNPFDLLQQMFQSGLEAQQENARTMQSLFDSLWRDGMTAMDPSKAKPAAKPGPTRR
jgi:hypothetical protein